MTDTTARLGLPVIAPSQAQKHVTHNEALVLLDGITQLVLTSKGAATPPSLPGSGEIHALGPFPTGVWAGQGEMLAQWVGNYWQFIVPQEGWLAWDLEDGALLVRQAGQWQPVLNNFTALGIGTSADEVNRLAVASDAVLLTHAGAGHQLKINKAAPSETNSLLFQTGWSGRAEMGCTGNDDFSIKVSADGSTFHDGLVVDAASGAVLFPNGVAGTGSAAGPMGGQSIAFVGERSGVVAVGEQLGFGDGSTYTVGPVLPFDAKVMAATLSVRGGAAGITTFDLTLDGVSDSAFQLALDYSGSGAAESVTADFSASPRAVSAGTALSLRCSATVGASDLVGALYLVFD